MSTNILSSNSYDVKWIWHACHFPAWKKMPHTQQNNDDWDINLVITSPLPIVTISDPNGQIIIEPENEESGLVNVVELAGILDWINSWTYSYRFPSNKNEPSVFALWAPKQSIANNLKLDNDRIISIQEDALAIVNRLMLNNWLIAIEWYLHLHVSNLIKQINAATQMQLPESIVYR
jgi:hypothetical protein